MDTREAAEALGLSVSRICKLAKMMQVGRNNGFGWWFTNDDIEALRNRVQIRVHVHQPHCPRCEILTPNGEICEECRFIERYGRYPVASELTGEIA